jgi:hypothetical protein
MKIRVGLCFVGFISMVLVGCTSAQSATTAVTATSAITNTAVPVTMTQEPVTSTPDMQVLEPELSPTIAPNTTAIPFRPTGTSMPTTPVPPLTVHGWQPNAVLIYADNQGGDGCCWQPSTPQFIVYADGRAFATRYIKVNGEYKTQILTYQFNSMELCQLLNTIDQIGFFDYDPSTYNIDMNNPPVDGTSMTYIRVNAWRSNSIELYGLTSLLHYEDEYADIKNRPPFPTILPALRATHNLLFSFPVDSWDVYRPERLGIWIYSKEKTTRNSIMWPLENYRLEEIYGELPSYTFSPQSIVIRGAEAQTIYEAIGNTMGDTSFTDGTYRYGIYARPLLPYETPPDADVIYPEIPAAIFPTPAYSLSCQPSDGVLTNSN